MGAIIIIQFVEWFQLDIPLEVMEGFTREKIG